MKVYYPGPETKTYHPRLGKLITGETFDLDDKLAEKYVDSGLLKVARSSQLTAHSSKHKNHNPETTTRKPKATKRAKETPGSTL